MSSKALARLRSLPNPRYNPVWPPGTPQKPTRPLIEYFCSLVSTCDTSLIQLLRDHPELPPFKQIDSWRVHNKNGFADQWKKARQSQAHFLANKCLQLAKTVDPKTAHVARVQFDIYRWFAARIHPDVYGEKPNPQPNNTTVNVGVSISPERLTEIRSKLDQTRVALQAKEATKNITGDNERYLTTPGGLTNGASSLRDRK